MKHFTFKQVGCCIFDSKAGIELIGLLPVAVAPEGCELVSIGNGVRFIAAFLSSPLLPEDDFSANKLPGIDQMAVVYQYNHKLSGYLMAYIPQ